MLSKNDEIMMGQIACDNNSETAVFVTNGSIYIKSKLQTEQHFLIFEAVRNKFKDGFYFLGRKSLNPRVADFVKIESEEIKSRRDGTFKLYPLLEYNGEDAETSKNRPTLIYSGPKASRDVANLTIKEVELLDTHQLYLNLARVGTIGAVGVDLYDKSYSYVYLRQLSAPLPSGDTYAPVALGFVGDELAGFPPAAVAVIRQFEKSLLDGGEYEMKQDDRVTPLDLETPDQIGTDEFLTASMARIRAEVEADRANSSATLRNRSNRRHSRHC